MANCESIQRSARTFIGSGVPLSPSASIFRESLLFSLFVLNMQCAEIFDVERAPVE